MYPACRAVEEVVFVSQGHMLVEVFRRSRDAWLLQTFGGHDYVELESLRIRFPIRQLYAGVEVKEWGLPEG